MRYGFKEWPLKSKKNKKTFNFGFNKSLGLVAYIGFLVYLWIRAKLGK